MMKRLAPALVLTVTACAAELPPPTASIKDTVAAAPVAPAPKPQAPKPVAARPEPVPGVSVTLTGMRDETAKVVQAALVNELYERGIKGSFAPTAWTITGDMKPDGTLTWTLMKPDKSVVGTVQQMSPSGPEIDAANARIAGRAAAVGLAKVIQN